MNQACTVKQNWVHASHVDNKAWPTYLSSFPQSRSAALSPNTAGIVVRTVHVRRRLLAKAAYSCPANPSFFLFFFLNIVLVWLILVVVGPHAAPTQWVGPSNSRWRSSHLTSATLLHWWVCGHCCHSWTSGHQRERACVCLCFCLCVRVCHSCSAEPGEVAGSPVGDLIRLLTFFSFSQACSGCHCSSWPELFRCPGSLSQRLLRSSGLREVCLSVAPWFVLNLIWSSPFSNCCGRIQFQKQSDIVYHVSSWKHPVSGPGHVWLGHCAAAASVLCDPQQMWGPITLHGVISGSRSWLHSGAWSQC